MLLNLPFLGLLACTALTDAPANTKTDTTDSAVSTPTDSEPQETTDPETDSVPDTTNFVGTSPVLLALRMSWSDIPNVGMTISTYVDFTDAEEDVVGGQLLLSYVGGDTGEAALEVVDLTGLDASKAQAIVEVTGTMFFGLANVDETQSYTFEVTTEDAHGYRSNTLTETLAPL